MPSLTPKIPCHESVLDYLKAKLPMAASGQDLENRAVVLVLLEILKVSQMPRGTAHKITAEIASMMPACDKAGVGMEARRVIRELGS